MSEITAVVTGGAGFIGSLLVDQLIADGNAVVAIDDLSTGNLSNLEKAKEEGGNNFQFVSLDVRSPQATELISDLKPKVVFHLAAQVDLRHSVNEPLLDAEINILGTLRILEGARYGGAEKVVVAASGGTLYGDQEDKYLPFKESLGPNPQSPYGISKATTMNYLSIYQDLYGLDGTALALANVYGPRQDPHGEAGVVAIFAGQLLEKNESTIFGTGKQTRDFVYVQDVVEAFIKASEVKQMKFCNIGTGKETSVNELYETMASLLKSPSKPKYLPSRSGEVERSALDPNYAQSSLDWISTTSLEDGLSKTIEWFKEN